MLYISLSRQIHLPHHQVDGVSAIYINSALRYLAVSLVQIFVPIYILQLTGSFAAIFYYYLYTRGVEVLLVPMIGQVINRLGFRLSVLISNILLCFYLLLLLSAEKNLVYLILSATILPFLALFYWLSYHAIFIRDGDQRRFQKQVAHLRLISQLFPALGPIAGGMVISFLGFSSLYLLAIVLVIFSSLPLFFMPHHRHDGNGQWLTLFAAVLKKKFRRYLLAFIGVGIEETIFTYLWPVFIFLMVKNYQTLGGIASISMILAVAALFLMGKKTREDKEERGKQGRLFRLGVAVAASIWLVRSMARTVSSLLALDTAYHLAGILVWLHFDTRMYEKAAQDDDEQFLLKRSISVNLGRTLGFALAGLMFVVGLDWKGVFLLGSLSLLLIRKMRE